MDNLDFSKMDFETFHQTIGGSFEEYQNFMGQFSSSTTDSMIEKEKPVFQKEKKIEEEIPQKMSKKDVKARIRLIEAMYVSGVIPDLSKLDKEAYQEILDVYRARGKSEKDLKREIINHVVSVRFRKR